jgi:hypothetical protein
MAKVRWDGLRRGGTAEVGDLLVDRGFTVERVATDGSLPEIKTDGRARFLYLFE